MGREDEQYGRRKMHEMQKTSRDQRSTGYVNEKRHESNKRRLPSMWY